MTDDQHIDSKVEEYADIRPYDDHQFHDKIAALVHEPGFEHAVRYVMPDVDYGEFTARLLSVKTQMEFQQKIMGPFLEMLVSRTTHGLSLSGAENIEPGKPHTFITNHRDIVLDASFLNLCFIREKLPITQVAIGNNLLIFDWITDLVKLNRSFIVKRDTGVREALEAAKHLSGYIHYAIRTLRESLWIAQREGRAKDSNDKTQESVVKMLSLGGDGDSKDNLLEINIVPVSISYEYDPNDYLKATEFLLKRLDPEYKKSPHDDLLSMETGLLQRKGRVHFQLSPCINDELSTLSAETPKAELIKQICHIIDRAIHGGYMIYPINYVAYDMLHNTDRFADRYTADDRRKVMEYIESQLDKVRLENVSEPDRQYMRHMMFTMYANPLRNKLAADAPDR